MTREERVRFIERVGLIAVAVFLAIVLVCELCGCAGQELANVANQGKFHLEKVENWGQDAAEILANTAVAMDSLDDELAILLTLEDAESKRMKVRTIEEKINSIGEALYSIDISVPVIEGRKAGQCLDAIIDFSGHQPEHANDNTLALHICRLKEAQIRIEKFKAAITKVTATIGAAIPGGSWLNHIWEIILGITTAYTGFRGAQHKKRAGKAERDNRFMVKAVDNLSENDQREAYEAIKSQLKQVVPDNHKAGFKAMVAQQLAKIKREGGTA